MPSDPALPTLNTSILAFYRNALGTLLASPRLLLRGLRVLFRQRRAAARRRAWQKKGIHVPPFLIISVTNRCNLKCAGCYQRLQHPDAPEAMDSTTLERIFREAEELGVGTILLAGGEPLTRKDLLATAAKFPRILFPLFSNGLLLDDAALALLKKHWHILPVLSLEGDSGETDCRRGEGVFANALKLFPRLKARGIFCGTSFTVTRDNFPRLTDAAYLEELKAAGCRLFFYIEYIPIAEGSEALVIEEPERQRLLVLMDEFRKKHRAVFVAFPGDEEKFGGCLAAGRGFAHINAAGSLEPCPFAPYSDTSLAEKSLKEALASGFLRTIRENHALLEEHGGGCSLWENRELVQRLLSGRADQ